jgi:hypothetical protein
MPQYTAFICLPGVYEGDDLDNCIELDLYAETDSAAERKARHIQAELELHVVKMTEW